MMPRSFDAVVAKYEQYLISYMLVTGLWTPSPACFSRATLPFLTIAFGSEAINKSEIDARSWLGAVPFPMIAFGSDAIKGFEISMLEADRGPHPFWWSCEVVKEYNMSMLEAHRGTSPFRWLRFVARLSKSMKYRHSKLTGGPPLSDDFSKAVKE